MIHLRSRSPWLGLRYDILAHDNQPIGRLAVPFLASPGRPPQSGSPDRRISLELEGRRFRLAYTAAGRFGCLSGVKYQLTEAVTEVLVAELHVLPTLRQFGPTVTLTCGDQRLMLDARKPFGDSRCMLRDAAGAERGRVTWASRVLQGRTVTVQADNLPPAAQALLGWAASLIRA